jgi:hypothetical protein
VCRGEKFSGSACCWPLLSIAGAAVTYETQSTQSKGGAVAFFGDRLVLGLGGAGADDWHRTGGTSGALRSCDLRSFCRIFHYAGLGGAEITRHWPLTTTALRAFAVTRCVALAVTARVQTAAWRNSDTLFRHAAAAPGNYEAYEHLGVAMELNAARIPEAIGILEESIRLRPARATGHLNLSTALLAAGRRQEAITQIEPRSALNPAAPRRTTIWAPLSSPCRTPQ